MIKQYRLLYEDSHGVTSIHFFVGATADNKFYETNRRYTLKEAVWMLTQIKKSDKLYVTCDESYLMSNNAEQISFREPSKYSINSRSVSPLLKS